MGRILCREFYLGELTTGKFFMDEFPWPSTVIYVAYSEVI